MKQIFEKVTKSLVENMKEIEASNAPAQWFKPWDESGFPQMPVNLATGAAYRGINAFMLYFSALEEGYRTNQWLTFKQKNSYNSEHDTELKIAKGSHGFPIFKYIEWVPKDFVEVAGGGYINTKTGRTADDPKTVALRKYTVFNLDQMENVPLELMPDDSQPDWEGRYREAHKMLESFKCPVKFGGDKAYYNPSRHFIMLPIRKQFNREVDYLATAFHEHVHSTGKILERDMSGQPGDDSYAREELVAEIGSALLCARFGIEAPMQHPQYIAGYIKRLESSDKAFWNAANQAQKAIDYLIGE